MARFDSHFRFRDVVLVADVISPTHSSAAIDLRRDLEMTDTATLQALKSAIIDLGLRVHHYFGPNDLAERAKEHQDDIVLTIYGGKASRNRMALVPAICETFRIRHIGPDVYGRIVAQDKEISKRLALDCGLRTPAWRVLRNERQLHLISQMNLPVVIKPVMEGSSIGISQRNRATSFDDAEALAKELLASFQPIIVEEFVPGREVAYCKIETADRQAWSFSEVLLGTDPTFFEDRLFDAQEKLFRRPDRTIKSIERELDVDDQEHIEELLGSFGSYGYCRVDGRLGKGKFHFLEITPDAWMGQHGQFAMSFTNKGWAYSDVIAAVLASAS
jgi:D-alanine-D-alanine ligase